MFDINGWQVREAGEEDLEAVALVGSAAILETYAGLLQRADMLAFCRDGHSAAAYRGYLAKGGRIWLGEDTETGCPLGYALLCPPEIDHAQDGDIELKRIYTLTRMQGSGLGKALMAAALAGAQGHRRLLLGVNAKNVRALAFYARQGFETIGSRRFLVGSVEHDDYVLACDLTARDLLTAPTV
ncbi:GNAT family N-acetyltransferase [Novosphingobium sp. 9]|uniref:GNAT family N-acetyltransferase n=1 Tax=Novosphingobium sp. 9 TaxID=2025349 RepID=UPI0021B66972|nr:GNAT family N-acetyltransferase [Novosphingobium sp. 9]